MFYGGLYVDSHGYYLQLLYEVPFQCNVLDAERVMVVAADGRRARPLAESGSGGHTKRTGVSSSYVINIGDIAIVI